MSYGRTRPILVGVDGSPESVTAARWAMAEAAMRQRPLQVACVYAWPAPLMPLAGLPAELTEDSLREDAERIATDVVAAVRDAELIELSEHTTMVVVGHRGHGGFAALRLGSVASNVAAHASCPVAVIRSAPDSAATRTVLVGVDGPRSSDPVLAFAFDEASRRNAELTALMAWERPHKPTGPTVATWTAEAAHRLHGLLQPWHEQHPDVAIEQRVSLESPARALLDAARQAELLVIGSRGRGGFPGLLLGSVSQQVIHYASGPVVVVR
jgi:nucleotide-binding universal stress UspA family protein